MGELESMKLHQHDIKSYVKNKQEKMKKPRLKIKTMKDVATLLGPNAKRYHISPNQRNFQLKGRLTIAAIAAALAIGGISAYSHTRRADTNTVETSNLSASDFEKNESISDAKEKLLDIIYPDLDSFKENTQIQFIHDDELDTDSIVVYERQKYQMQTQEKFRYTRFNRPEDFMKKDKDCKEISEWLNLVIDAYYNENISKEDLRILDGTTLNIDAKKFKLDNNAILGKSELDKDFER